MREKSYTISYGYISREQLIKERDALRAKNEKLKEALREIVELYKPLTLSLTAIKMCMVAEQALNEVTK